MTVFLIPDHSINSLSETIKENICESIRKATKVFEYMNEDLPQILKQFPVDSERTGPPAHQNVLNIILQFNNLSINSIPCQWPSTSDQNVWFYITMASSSDLKVYILFVNQTSPENPLVVPVGVVMEFLKLKAIPNGHVEFQEMFINYNKKKCK